MFTTFFHVAAPNVNGAGMVILDRNLQVEGMADRLAASYKGGVVIREDVRETDSRRLSEISREIMTANDAEGFHSVRCPDCNGVLLPLG